MRPVPFVLAVSLVALPSPALDPPGGAAYGDMAVDLLREYLQIDTTNPPGHELRAARFYKRVLDREGIPAEIDEFAPGRANLLATLAGGGARRPLILANHMDVVPADASRWTIPPFSAAVKDGLIYFNDTRNGLFVVRYTGPHAGEVPTSGVYSGDFTTLPR